MKHTNRAIKFIKKGNKKSDSFKNLEILADANLHQQTYDLVEEITKFKNKENFRILDIACGNGAFSARLRDHGFIYIDSCDINDIDENFVYAEFKELWSVPYPRAVENQLDVMHLPFVHRTTIGRGNRTLVHGPVVKWIDEDEFFFYVFNEVDVGQKVKRPEELNLDRSRVYLEFIFPNTWQNHITKDIRVVAFFAPVDRERTMIYLRFYVGVTKIKPLDKLIAALGMTFNRKVLHQDKRVVETQKHDIRKDMLVQGDLPIMEFRKRLFREKRILEFLYENPFIVREGDDCGKVQYS